MFQFSAFALHPYTFRVKYPCGWVAPFGHPRIEAWLPAPRGLSQVPASFIASRRQDIRHALLLGHTNRTPRLQTSRVPWHDPFSIFLSPCARCFLPAPSRQRDRAACFHTLSISRPRRPATSRVELRFIRIRFSKNAGLSAVPTFTPGCPVGLVRGGL